MYTNEILEEKYKAQRELTKKAVIEKKDYFEIIKDEVRDLFNKNCWEVRFYNGKGVNIENTKL